MIVQYEKYNIAQFKLISKFLGLLVIMEKLSWF